ncbi:murein biosynthesis integral membrane protein MurJ [Phytohabitans aurantiacus]|jgi:putative peptidoglycan lipid II flippase|uniref:Lipid II flippase MurJ n=1 Tax=Phytohabitans aurantiacus TaxID=3016789 RepID=A0ABQ5QPJ7_9ACTN|nr:murein biosynthesis integral membrane protein MurJ [Phytohabitans aurantiacus]GLH95235.1 lipid II flippase MurJ [Phytohabitans aurantiacus]
MSGGLYRSANAGHLDPSEADGAVLISTAGAPPPVGAGSSGVDQQPGEASAASNSAIMAIGSLVSRGTGFLRTLVLAAALGGGAIGDAYTTAQVVPSVVYELLLGGILASVVIPMLVRRRKADADGGQAYTQRLLTLAVVVLGVAALLATLSASLLTALYASDKQGPDFQDLVTQLSYLMLPMIFFIGISGVLSAVLNTRGHFATPMFTPILNNLVVIATGALYMVIYGAKAITPGQMTAGQIAVIGGGTLLGVVVQSAGLFPALRKVGFKWRWRFDFRALGLRELGRLGGWALCYVVATQVGQVVAFKLLNAASGEDAPGPMIYNNVFLLMMMAHGIISVSIITALAPRMSGAAADNRNADLAADLARGTRMITAVLTPVAICYAVLAAPISITLFQRGAYTAENATDTALVLVVAAVALVPFSISQLYTVGFYARQETKTSALINLPVVGLRILVQLVIFALFSAAFAAPGLMFANAVSYVAGALFSAMLLRRRIGAIPFGAILANFVKVGIAAVGATVVGIVVVYLLPGDWTPTRPEAILQLVIGGLVIVGTYIGIALGLKVSEITEVIGMVRRKIGR